MQQDKSSIKFKRYKSPLSEMYGLAIIIFVYGIGLLITNQTMFSWAAGFPIVYFLTALVYEAYKVIKGGTPEGMEK